VALIDSGADSSHPDIETSVVSQHCFQVFSTGTRPDGTDLQAGPGPGDDNDGHGTQMASLIASDGGSTPIGTAPDARLHVLRITDRVAVDLRDVLLALDHILDTQSPIDIVSMSLGSSARFPGVCERDLWPAFHDTIAALLANGIFVTASTGNNADQAGQQFPACLADVYAVTGLSVQGDVVASTTNTSATTNLAAPSTGLAVHDQPIVHGGTSAANAITAGCAALAVDADRGGPVAIEPWLRSPNDAVLGTSGRSIPVLQCAPYCHDAPVTVNLALGERPTAQSDVILGTDESDVILAGAGDDLVCASGGDDLVVGGQGNDTISGDSGAERLWGNFGDDVLVGGAGADTLHGNAGNYALRAWQMMIDSTDTREMTCSAAAAATTDCTGTGATTGFRVTRAMTFSSVTKVTTSLTAASISIPVGVTKAPTRAIVANVEYPQSFVSGAADGTAGSPTARHSPSTMVWCRPRFPWSSVSTTWNGIFETASSRSRASPSLISSAFSATTIRATLAGSSPPASRNLTPDSATSTKRTVAQVLQVAATELFPI